MNTSATILLLLSAQVGKGQTRNGDSTNQPGDAGGNGRHNPFAGQFFMNRFRKLGFIEYARAGCKFICSLLNVVSARLVDCRRVTITKLLASNLAWPPVAKSFSPNNSIPS
jgi:hypothetical protein